MPPQHVQRVGGGITVLPGCRHGLRSRVKREILRQGRKQDWQAVGITPGRSPSRGEFIGHQHRAENHAITNGLGKRRVVVDLNRGRPRVPSRILGVGQVKIECYCSGAGSPQFVDGTSQRSSRPGPAAEPLQRTVVNVYHDDLGGHGGDIAGEVPLLKVEDLLVPGVESSADIDQDDEQRGEEGREQDLGADGGGHGSDGSGRRA